MIVEKIVVICNFIITIHLFKTLKRILQPYP